MDKRVIAITTSATLMLLGAATDVRAQSPASSNSSRLSRAGREQVG
jgi:hypothetical protein